MEDEFKPLTLEDARRMVVEASVLLLLNYFIANAMTLDTIRKSKESLYKFEEEARKELRGT